MSDSSTHQKRRKPSEKNPKENKVTLEDDIARLNHFWLMTFLLPVSSIVVLLFHVGCSMCGILSILVVNHRRRAAMGGD